MTDAVLVALRALQAAAGAAVHAGATETQVVMYFQTGLVEALDAVADSEAAVAGFEAAAAHFDQPAAVAA